VNREQIIRAWKDEEYRSGLSESEQALLPAHPAGVVELDGAELDSVAGANLSELLSTYGCCPNLFSLLCELNTMNIKGLLGCPVSE
jgi:mersacidin/lichenicidin family type 2 lantibiotic